MDKRNLKIISYLRQNARISLTSLSRKTGVPVSTLFDKIKAKQGVFFERYTTLLKYDKLGFSTRANVLIKICKTNKPKLIEYLLKHPHVNNPYRINNGWDLQLECVFCTMRELEEFLEKLELEHKIKSKEVHYIIEELKREGFLSDPEIVELVILEH